MRWAISAAITDSVVALALVLKPIVDSFRDPVASNLGFSDSFESALFPGTVLCPWQIPHLSGPTIHRSMDTPVIARVLQRRFGPKRRRLQPDGPPSIFRQRPV